MKGFKGLKLWPNATGNILMLISIILVAIIVIGGLVWGFSSKKENFYSQTEPKTAIIKNVLPSPFILTTKEVSKNLLAKKTTTDVIQIAREAMAREAAAKEVAKETSRIAQAAREAAQVAIAREAQAARPMQARPMQARPTPVFLSQAVQPMSKQGMMIPVFKQ